VTTAPSPVPAAPRARLENLLDRILRGPEAAKARHLILAEADEYAARMAELAARPDDRWGPQ